MRAPIPYFGGKSTVASYVWRRFGVSIANYVEPFYGSGAIHLARPKWSPEETYTETINDQSGLVANFWRSVKLKPEEVAYHADNIVSECDLHARHLWLVTHKESLAPQLEADPFWCDPQAAGWWCWGACCWIGSGFCSGKGPWVAQKDANGNMVLAKRGAEDDGADGISRQLVAMGTDRGVHRKLVHLGDNGKGVNRGGISRQGVHLGSGGAGVNRQIVHLGNGGTGVNRAISKIDYSRAGEGEAGIYAWMDALSARLRRVRVCCGDWKRVMGFSVTEKNGISGIFLDPPYGEDADRTSNVYDTDSLTVAADVRQWCMENGGNPKLRIAFCGYRGEHDELEDQGWDAYEWKAKGGYGSQSDGQGRENAAREVIWFSPACLPVERKMSLFDLLPEEEAEF